MAAFGGSYLNHQFLISGRVPEYFNAKDTAAKKKIAVLDDGPTGFRLSTTPDSPASAMDGHPHFVNNGAITPDGYAVNTMAPPYQPSYIRPAFDGDPLHADPKTPAPCRRKPTTPSATCCRAKHQLGVVWRRMAGGARCARRRREAELPVPPSAVQLLQAVRAGHQGARGTPARRRPGRQPDLEQIHRRRGGRQAAGRDLLQAAG
jgi:acid phosphatase